MISNELIAYIKNQLSIGQTKEVITQNLLSNKWSIDDVSKAIEYATALDTQTVDVIEVKKPSKTRLILIIFTVILVLLVIAVTAFFIYKEKNTIRFHTLEANELYLPTGYSIKKVDEPNEKGTIYGTTLENVEKNAKIVIMRYKGKIKNCTGEFKQINSIQYCIIDNFSPDGVIKKAVIWDYNGLTFDMTTSDSNISIDELLKVAEPFTKAIVIPST